MKRKIFIVIGVVLVALVGYGLYGFLTTRNLSPRETTKFSAGGLDISVSYGRPSKRGRLVFGEEKDKPVRVYGQYWRLGANDATEITFSKDINFAGQPVKKGSYRMYAIPNPAIWQVTLNSELGKFGYFEPDYKLDVLKVDVPSETCPETEQFTIKFSNDSTGVKMDFVWDKTLLRIPITIQ